MLHCVCCSYLYLCRTELLEIGDRILAVNGTSTDDITHDAVARLLQSAGTTVYLEIEYDLPDNGMLFTKFKCNAPIHANTLPIPLKKSFAKYDCIRIWEEGIQICRYCVVEGSKSK